MQRLVSSPVRAVPLQEGDRKEVTAVATAPTNENIAAMLERVLRELEDIKKAQKQLATDVKAVAKKAKT